MSGRSAGIGRGGPNRADPLRTASGGDVTLVIPGRNASRTLGRAIGSVLALPKGSLREVLFVDDGSTDDSGEIARSLGVTVLSAGGRGPGAARNVGWRQATTEWVWFIDADCSVGSDSLAKLLEMADRAESDDAVSGVGGSYANAVPESLLARIIHAEIRERHLAMEGETDYLGSFNVLYRRRALDEAGGFDESWVNGPAAPGAEDADLSYRLASAGHRLLFSAAATVAHHHPVSLSRYLRAQRLHGFWGVRLYRRHPARGRANTYSGQLDHLQPVLALAVLGAVPVAALFGGWWTAGLLLLVLVLSTLPMTVRLVRRRGAEMLAFIPLATVRAFARGLGMLWGILDMVTPGDWRPKR